MKEVKNCFHFYITRDQLKVGAPVLVNVITAADYCLQHSRNLEHLL